MIVYIMSQAEIEALVDDEGPDLVIVSITDTRAPDANLKKQSTAHIYRLKFDDYAWNPKMIEEQGGDQLRALVPWLQSKSHLNKWIIHCHAGISRSSAVALFLAEIYGARVVGGFARKSPNLGVLSILRWRYRYSEESQPPVLDWQ